MIQKLAKILRYINRSALLNSLKKSGQIHNSLKIGDNHCFELSPRLKTFIINQNVKFYNDVNITIGKDAELEIGENTTVNKYSSFVSLHKIKIGNNCLIGENVKIYDNNHKIDVINNRKIPHHKEFNTEPVYIGNNCWLGSNVTVLKGVTIGDNSIIGAGCTIYKDVPENTTVINKQDLIFKQH